jgi:hypothetical protein
VVAALLAAITLSGCRRALSDADLLGVWMSPSGANPRISVTFIVGGRAEVAEEASAPIPARWRRDGGEIVVDTAHGTHRLGFDGEALADARWRLIRL